MKFIIGKKQEMSQIFSEGGIVIPVTRVIAGPCFVSAKKDVQIDGYQAVQVAFQEASKVNNPLKGFFNKVFKNNKIYSKLKEFRIDSGDAMFDKLAVGQELTVSMFNPGDIISVQGVSKGKGFQGVVKRHHFHGSPASHGHKDQLRMPGSLGAGEPQHVFKGKRMGGHMGDETVTVSNLEIIEVNTEKNELLIKGAVPGGRNAILYIEAPGIFEITQEPLVGEVVEEEKNIEVQPVNDQNDQVDNIKEPQKVIESVEVEGNNK
jgi:large subunit ribosomal protein L3